MDVVYDVDMAELSNKNKQSKNLTERLVDKYLGLEDGEEVVLLVRKHWALFRNEVLLALFVPFVLLFFVYFFNEYPLGWSEDVIHYLTMALIILSGLAFVWGTITFLWRLYLWHNTFYVMTNRKLAVINQKLPWEYEVQQISVKNINDVTLKQTGFQSLIYGYSDVTAVTYSGSSFTFKDVGRPTEVQKAIMRLVGRQKGVDGAPGVGE